MSRKRRTSPFEDLIKLASVLPYWISLILAVGSYFILHSLADPVTPEIQPGRAVPSNMVSVFLQPVFFIFQFAVPAAFILGAAVSGFKSFEARSQAKRYEQWSAPKTSASSDKPVGNKAKPTDAMNWAQFELLVGEAFRKKGYRVIHGGDAGADGGIDVRLRKNGKEYLVQCKHWKTKRVGVAVIRELYGVMVSSGVAGGYVVTSGEFTEEAVSFSEGKPIKLVNGDALARMLGRELEVASEGAVVDKAHKNTVSCPKCGAPMVRRKAKRGQNAGNEFWGCSRFPKCRGTYEV